MPTCSSLYALPINPLLAVCYLSDDSILSPTVVGAVGGEVLPPLDRNPNARKMESSFTITVWQEGAGDEWRLSGACIGARTRDPDFFHVDAPGAVAHGDQHPPWACEGDGGAA